MEKLMALADDVAEYRKLKPLVNAYYRGKNHAHYGDPRLSRSDFATEAEYASYCRGWNHSIAEDRLNNDPDWDHD